MSRALVCLPLAACAAQDPCSDIDPATPRKLADHHGPASSLTAQRSGDHVYMNVGDPGAPTSLYVGPRCGDATMVARGIAMEPARTRPDPDDDDPTLACNPSDGRFYRLDLRGRELPTFVHPAFSCNTVVGEHGVFVRARSVLTFPLWQYTAFPDPASATQISADAGVVRLRGRDLFYYARSVGYFRRDLATGETAQLDAEPGQPSDTHLLWWPRPAPDDVPPAAPVRLLELASGAQIELGVFDLDVDSDLSWRFEPGEAFVVHGPRIVDAAIEAFDLRGAPVPLPAPGLLLHVFAGGEVVSITADGALFTTKIGAAAPTALDLRLDVDLEQILVGAHGLFRLPPFAADHLEVNRGDDVWRVPLDGGPASLLARDAGPGYAWLGESHLLAAFADELVTIAVPDGERRVIARGVTAFASAGAPTDVGVHYVGDGGLWYAPPAALLADG